MLLRIKNHFFMLLLLILAIIPGYVYGAQSNITEEVNPNKSSWICLPIIGDESEAGMMFGGILINSNYKNAGTENSQYMFNFVYSNEDYLQASLDGEKYFQSSKTLLLTGLRYRDWPEKFYGIGMKNILDNGEKYTFGESGFNTSYLWKWRSNSYIGPVIRYSRFEIDDKPSNGLLNTSNINGRNDTTVVGVGMHLRRNTHNPNFSSQGDNLDIQTIFYRDSLGSDLNFSQLNLDYRRFYELSPQHILGFHGLMVTSEGNVPFEMQPVLGNTIMMRGCDGKYRDDNYLAFQGEYRFPINRTLGGVVFAGLGEIFSNENYLNFDDLQPAGGLGLRYALFQKAGINMRLDIGFSEENTSFIISYGEAF